MAQSNVQAQNPVSRDLEAGNGDDQHDSDVGPVLQVGSHPESEVVDEEIGNPAAPHKGSGVQTSPPRSPNLFATVEKELAQYDAREKELETKYRQEEKLRHDRELAVRKQRQLSSKCVDADSDDDDYCYNEIKTLVLIERSVIHKRALEEWERKEKLFTSRVDRKSKKVGNLKNEVYQLIGFFSVFQGVVLTAVAQSNLLHCNNRWSPIVLSVLASVVTVAGVAQKLLQISSLQKTISTEVLALQEAVHRGSSLRKSGKDFVFKQVGKAKNKRPKKEHSRWYTVVVLSFLFLFTFAFPLSHWRILCDPGPNPYGLSA